MYIICNACGKEFNDLIKGLKYSSTVSGLLLFYSDACCNDYLNKGKAVEV
jgi:hypothetical protein